MKSKNFLVILFTFFYLISYGQDQDTLVFYNEVTFASDFEKSAFRDHFEAGKKNYLALFMAIDKNITEEKYQEYKQVYESKIASIDKNKIQKKTGKKKIKYLYNDIHELFFKKYELQNHFSSIFHNGFYNCVSGSALYAMAFEEFDIPYIVKEKPTHVYLMTYPKSERILVEPTDPRIGYMVFTDTYKAAFIENLKAAKIVSSDESKNQSINQLFDKYYFAEENITLEELVGIQYTNDALYKLDKQDFEGAFHQVEKAYLFYPSEKIASLLFLITAEILSKSEYEDIKYAHFLAKLSRFEKFGIKKTDIVGEFVRANNILLIDKNLKEKYKEFYEALISQIKDTVITSEISFIYFYENGRVLYNQGKFDEALSFLQNAYQIKTENHDINNLFVSTISQCLRYQSDNKKLIKALEDYSVLHPTLLDNNVFKSMLVNTYLIQFFYSFDLNSPTEGLKYKDLFHKYYAKELTIDEGLIGRAFGTAAVYYFRKGNKSKAISFINEGLQLSPNNHELRTRKMMIN